MIWRRLRGERLVVEKGLLLSGFPLGSVAERFRSGLFTAAGCTLLPAE